MGMGVGAGVSLAVLALSELDQLRECDALFLPACAHSKLPGPMRRWALQSLGVTVAFRVWRRRVLLSPVVAVPGRRRRWALPSLGAT